MAQKVSMMVSMAYLTTPLFSPRFKVFVPLKHSCHETITCLIECKFVYELLLSFQILYIHFLK